MIILVPNPEPDANKRRQVYGLYRDACLVYEGKTITIPAGFQYDGASIPRPLWPIIGSPFRPEFMQAALFHDWLYHVHQTDRKQADELLRLLLVHNGVGEGRAWIMKTAVRLFGWRYWRNDAEDIAYLSRLNYPAESLQRIQSPARE